MAGMELQYPTSDLFVADDIIRTAQALQTHLADVPKDSQPEVAAQALDALGDPREIYGLKQVIVHAFGAMVLRQDLSLDDVLYHNTYFGDVYFRSTFNRFAYIRFGSRLSGLALSLHDSEVLKAADQARFEGETIKTGVFVPIHGVESVLAAA